MLGDLNFKEDLKLLCDRMFLNVENIEPDVWDLFKEECKKLAKFHCKRLNMVFRSKYKSVQKQFYHFRDLNKSFPGVYDSKVQDCENTLNSLLEEYNEGFRVRSKVNKLSFDEKASRFFLNKACHRAKRKVIDKLDVRYRDFVKKREDILFHVREFYKQLFTKESIDQSLVDYFLSDLNVLTEEQSQLCEGLLTKCECFNALSNMKNNKSPGVDGLQKEFYILNWELIGDYFVKMANTCFKRGILSKTPRLGIITLICKDPEKACDLKFWRPISLLCLDYKIISKCLTNRVKKVIWNLIHIDQTAAVVGRSIQYNIHLLRNILDYSHQNVIDLFCFL